MSDRNATPVVLLMYAQTGEALDNLQFEIEAIEAHLVASGLCDVKVVPAAALSDVVTAINEPKLRDRVSIVHYAGHANGRGIQLQNTSAGMQGKTAYMRGLAEVLKTQPHLRLLFLNGCASREQVLELTQAGIPLVIATNQGIDDKVAREFAEYFYRTLGQQRSIIEAFQVAAGSLQASAGTNVRGVYFGEFQKSAEAQNKQWPWELHGPEADRRWSLQEPYYRGTGPRWDHTKYAFNSDSPYLGLRYFAEEDSSRFFGRDEFVQTLLTASEAAPLLLVIGASGIGKSSVVRAGMIPHWKKKHGGVSRDRVFVFTPQDDPFEQLATELARIDTFDRQLIRNIRKTASPTALRDAVKTFGQREPWLFFVDQFEQIFTRTTDQKKRSNFLDAITDLAKSEHPNVSLLLAMRDDFFSQLRDYPELFPLTDNHCFRVAALSRTALQEVIERPVAEHGVTFQPGLVSHIVEAVDRQPGALPLLQYVLDALWKSDDLSDRLLKEATYNDLGGVTGSLGRRLQKLYEQQDASGKDQFRWMMLKLVTFDEDETLNIPVSRLAPKSGFVGRQNEMLDQLISQGLVVSSGTSTPSVQLGHEKIIEAWQELAKWAQEHREANAVRQELSKAASKWVSLKVRGRFSNESLWQGAQLVNAMEFHRRGDFDQLDGLDKNEKRFLDVSYSRSQRLVRGLQWAFVIAGVLAIFGWWSFNEAKDSTRESNRQKASVYWQLGVIARNDGSGIESAFNFLQAAQAHEQAGGAADKLHQRNFQMASDFAISNLERSFPHDSSTTGVRVNKDGTLVLSWCSDGAVKLWSLTQAKPLKVWSLGSTDVTNAMFIKNESHVFAWNYRGEMKLWDVTKEEPLKEWKHDGGALDAVFTRNGGHLLTWGAGLKYWDVTQQDPLAELTYATVQGVKFTRDESCVLIWGKYGEVELIDVNRRVPLQTWRIDGHAIGAAFTTDESFVLAWSREGKLTCFDRKQSQRIHEWDVESNVEQALFTRDMYRVLFRGDRTLTLWDLEKAKKLQVWQHERSVKGAKFTQDELHVLAWGGSEDAGEVRLWDAKKEVPLRIWKDDRAVNGAEFNPDESLIMTWNGTPGTKRNKGEVKIWDRAKDFPLQEWSFNGSVNDALFNDDGSRILAWSFDGEMKLLDVMNRTPFQEWRHMSSIRDARFLQRGSRILASSYDGEMKLWNVTKSDPLQTWQHNGSLIDIIFRHRYSKVDGGNVFAPAKRYQQNRYSREPIFTRDGSHVLAWRTNEVTLWNLSKAVPSQAWSYDKPVTGALFSRDESLVLAWSEDGCIRLWDVIQKKVLRQWAHLGIKGASFAQGDSHVLSWGDRSLKLWKIENSDYSQEPAHDWKVDTQVDSAEFNKDASRVLTWTLGGEVKSWDVTKDIPRQVFEHQPVYGSPGNAVFTSDASRVLDWYGTSGDGWLESKDLATGESLQLATTNMINVLVFSGDDSRVITGMGNNLKLWEVTNETPLQEWEINGKVEGAKFLRNESRVLAWSQDGVVKLWDVTKKDPLLEWEHERFVNEPLCSYDESRILSWGNDDLKLWDVSKRQLQQVWKHEGTVRGAVFSRNESSVLTWFGNGDVILWDVTKTDPTQVWRHKSTVNGAQFSIDESRILTWSEDGEVKLWDVTKSEPLHTWKHPVGVAGAVLKCDESRVVAWSGDGMVTLWNCKLRNPYLTPAEQVLELEIRSASRLNSAGQLVPLQSDQWTQAVNSPHYSKIIESAEGR